MAFLITVQLLTFSMEETLVYEIKLKRLCVFVSVQVWGGPTTPFERKPLGAAQGDELTAGTLKWLEPEVTILISVCSSCDKEENSPICSTMSGGKTREAKARRKMSENSLSRPPMPIFSKFQSGLMMDWRDSLVLAFPGGGQTGTRGHSGVIRWLTSVWRTLHSHRSYSTCKPWQAGHSWTASSVKKAKPAVQSEGSAPPCGFTENCPEPWGFQ